MEWSLHKSPSVKLRTIIVVWGLGLLGACQLTAGDGSTRGKQSNQANSECFVQLAENSIPITETGSQGIRLEEDYLVDVVACEHGAADAEALKAQAIAARSYWKYVKSIESRALATTQSDQVLTGTCATVLPPVQYNKIRRAVEETRGVVMAYDQKIVAAFYVAGGAPDRQDHCFDTSGDTAHYVTNYPALNEANGVDAPRHPYRSSIGDAGSEHNIGCMSQNGASCFEAKGLETLDILKNYYGQKFELTSLDENCTFGNKEFYEVAQYKKLEEIASLLGVERPERSVGAAGNVALHPVPCLRIEKSASSGNARTFSLEENQGRYCGVQSGSDRYGLSFNGVRVNEPGTSTPLWKDVKEAFNIKIAGVGSGSQTDLRDITVHFESSDNKQIQDCNIGGTSC
ncbi:MAG: SpoIID/LytB domain-containing protein [Polyangiales bacterium]